jgi:hypothetical protein
MKTEYIKQLINLLLSGIRGNEYFDEDSKKLILKNLQEIKSHLTKSGETSLNSTKTPKTKVESAPEHADKINETIDKYVSKTKRAINKTKQTKKELLKQRDEMLLEAYQEEIRNLADQDTTVKGTV